MAWHTVAAFHPGANATIMLDRKSTLDLGRTIEHVRHLWTGQRSTAETRGDVNASRMARPHTLSPFVERHPSTWRGMGNHVQAADFRIPESTLDVIVCIDSNGAVVDWNSRASEFFGWTRQAIAGRSIASILLPPHLRDRFQTILERGRVAAPGSNSPTANRLQFLVAEHNGVERTVEMTVQPVHLQDAILFTLFLRVLAEPSWPHFNSAQSILLEKLQRNSHLDRPRRTGEIRNQAETEQQSPLNEIFESAILQCLEATCEIAGCAVGHAWVPVAGEEHFECSSLWHLRDSMKFAELPTLFHGHRVSMGAGFPGQILASRGFQASREETVDDRLSLLRGRPALGLRHAFGFPVFVQDEVVAILEFYSPLPLKDDPQVAHWAEAIAHQFGRILDRRSWEEERLRLAAIVDSTRDAIISRGVDGRITSWNAGAEELYGYDADEALGQPASMLIPEHLDQEEPELIYVIQHGIRLNQFETTRRRKDGKIVTVSMTVSPVHDADGTIVGSSSIERDTTRRNQREEQLRQETRAAESAVRTKNEFLANVSHELRTPMNAIIGMIELARAGDELSDIVRDYLDTANDSAHVLLSLLDDLLDFSRMEAGHFELDWQPFSLRSTLEEAMRILSLRAHERGIELACEIRPEVPDRLNGDARRLRQIVMNLVGNAIKFTEQGEVVLQVGVESRNHPEIQLLLSVRDTGIGIAPDDQERIFAPFTQVDASTTRRFTGSGLGLSICRELVERMHGKIWLESRLGRGTTFYCTPRFHVLEEANPVSTADMSFTKGLSALIVDDNSTNRRIVESILKGWGINCDSAADGQSALRKIERMSLAEQPYGMTFIDGLMPEMDGFSVLEQIRAQRWNCGPQILMLSAADRSAFEERIGSLTISAFLEKPVFETSLLNAVTHALRGPKQRAEITSQGPSSTPALRILVAEDTPANQRVVRTFLERRGHQVDIANNGREAVDLHERAPYDAILMDVQMPTMDGLQATSAIRSLRNSLAQVPIIAMTAHAMRGDRERCLNAGMDGYLSKPIDAMKLVTLVEEITREHSSKHAIDLTQRARVTANTLHEVVPRQEPVQNRGARTNSLVTAVAPVQSGSRTEIMSDASTGQGGFAQGQPEKAGMGDKNSQLEKPSTDKPVLHIPSALARLGGDQALLADMARFFLEDSAQLLAEIQQALDREDAESVHRNAHSLKGLASNFSAEPCVISAQAVEDAGRKRKLDVARLRLSSLQNEVAKLKLALQKEVLQR